MIWLLGVGRWLESLQRERRACVANPGKVSSEIKSEVLCISKHTIMADRV
jgi:hypothetical protein